MRILQLYENSMNYKLLRSGYEYAYSSHFE